MAPQANGELCLVSGDRESQKVKGLRAETLGQMQGQTADRSFQSLRGSSSKSLWVVKVILVQTEWELSIRPNERWIRMFSC